jgi:hypothetical protein
VEWALNQIATGSGDTINSKFGTQATNATNEGKMTCPFSSDCNIYLLDSSGNVIPKYQFGNPNSADLVKAVRSVGSQNQETQRAIEAAVAGTGGGCYVSFTGSCLSGFTDAGDAGTWGVCYVGSSCAPSMDCNAFYSYNNVCPNDPYWNFLPLGMSIVCCK